MKALFSVLFIFVALVVSLTGTCVQAAPITWNTWTSATAGDMGPVGVSFTANGSWDALYANYPSYTPTATFADGLIVDNAPVRANGILQLSGGNANINTVSFSTAVINPVFAIWSLGQGGILASYNFIDLTPIYVSGGTSAEYTGQPISILGNVVSGREGNGTVQFLGTYSSISWTNPVYEFWYGFNVGITGVADVDPVPEPGTILLLGFGLIGLAWLKRSRKQA